MVGYLIRKIEEDSRVVCSPDLPFNVTKVKQTQAQLIMTATSTNPGQPGTVNKSEKQITITPVDECSKQKLEEICSASGQKRKDMFRLMSADDAYTTSGIQVKRKLLTIDESYGSSKKSEFLTKDLLKMVSIEEAYDIPQNTSIGQSSSPNKRKDMLSPQSTEDPYQCNICSKTFAVPARLTRHYRTHTGEKPFQCEYCAKSFSVKENLSVHRRIHTKERPYKCEVCARAFEHSGKLHRHMRIHTGERPHKCGVCGKTFIQSGQLVIHTRTHTGEKPYVCSACGKGFTCSKQLKVHSRTHTGEKPYACDICGKSFGYNHVLKLHQVAHYGEKVYKCTICNDTFTSKKCMESHIKSHSESPTSPSPLINNGSNITSTSTIMAASTSSIVPENNTTSSIGSPESQSLNSDKENTSAEEIHSEERYYDYISQGPYTHQSGVDLLAAAAAATNLSSLDPTLSLTTPEDVLSLISSRKTQNSASSSNMLFQTHTNNIRMNQFTTPESRNSPQMSTNYGSNIDNGIKMRVETILAAKSGSGSHFVNVTPETDVRKRVEAVLDLKDDLSLHIQRLPTELKDLDHGNDIRRRVEAALASTIDSGSLLVITPPNSTSVSPSSSPEPIDSGYQPSETAANPSRNEISLPPRKRSKMILKSMQMDPTIRYNSVIQYAKAV